MFNLRKEQLTIFAAAGSKDLEQRMVAYVVKEFPKQSLMLKEAGLVELARYGIGRAAAYGIVAEPDVARYINVMFTLGKDFDRDPRYPWAARTLNDASLGEPSARINRLCAEALEATTGKGTGA